VQGREEGGWCQNVIPGTTLLPLYPAPTSKIICQSVGDPHIQTVGFGFPAHGFDCHTIGYVPVLRNPAFNLSILVQQRRLYTGEPATSNTALEVVASQTVNVHIINGKFAFDGVVYTRTEMLNAVKAFPDKFLGLRIYETQTGHGVVLELKYYHTYIQLNFWNNQGSSFFDLYVHVPNTLNPVDGICKYKADCPTETVYVPSALPWHVDSPMGKLFVVDPDVGIFGTRVFDDSTITDDIVNTACASLKDVSDFFYAACRYDVRGIKNPNVANVLLQSANTIVNMVVDLVIASNSTNSTAAAERLASLGSFTKLDLTSLVVSTATQRAGSDPVVVPVNVVSLNPVVAAFPDVTTTDLGNNVVPPVEEPSAGVHVYPAFASIFVVALFFAIA